jgi:hypothetical protein
VTLDSVLEEIRNPTSRQKVADNQDRTTLSRIEEMIRERYPSLPKGDVK